MKKYQDQHEFQPLLVEIEDRPINPLGKWILWLVVLAIFLGAIWLFVAKIDVVVTARGKIVPIGNIKLLQPLQTGVVSKILVKEGDYVKKGDLLIQIDSSVTSANLQSQKQNLKIAQIKEQRLKALINSTPFISSYQKQNRLYQNQKDILENMIIKFNASQNQLIAQYKSTKSQISKITTQLNQKSQQLDQMKQVLDIIAKKEYLELQSEIQILKQEHKILQQKLIELTQEKEKLAQEKNIYKNQFLLKYTDELLQTQKEIIELKAKIETTAFQYEKEQIKSPVDGYVGKLLIHTPQGIVTPAQKLISIIPKNQELIVEAKVLNQDRGFIKKDMEVAVKIDTFNFQKYGSVKAEVLSIATDAIEDEKLGLIYEIKIKLKKRYLIINHQPKNLKSGMSVTSEIKVGKRRVIEFFIYPLIKYMDEGLSVR